MRSRFRQVFCGHQHSDTKGTEVGPYPSQLPPPPPPNGTLATIIQIVKDATRFLPSNESSAAAMSSGPHRPIEETTTIRYVGGVCEQRETGSLVEHVHYIAAGDEVIAVRTTRSTGMTSTRYLHRDHLGSVDAVTAEAGNVVKRMSCDAFGKRRQADWSADAADGLLSEAHVTDRGYTFHEHLDHVELIHMNGRVYDPIVGRFMSADPLVQAPFNTQSPNRYSYVFNNPLTLVDPSGHTAICVTVLPGMPNCGGPSAPPPPTFTLPPLNALGQVGGFSTGLLTLLQGNMPAPTLGSAPAAGLMIAANGTANVGSDAGGTSSGGDAPDGQEPTEGRQSAGEGGKFANGGQQTRTSGLLQGAQDGHLTLDEANAWWGNMNGQPLTVELNRIDLSGISVRDFPEGEGSYRKLSVSGINDFLVHGKLGFTLGPNRTVTVGTEMYDFDIKPWSGNFLRNIATIMGRAYAGPGTPFPITYSGSAQIDP